jgi:uncharacterized membrane protein YccF (DUF307 family)
MTLLGNLLWLVLAGWWLALAYVVAGIINIVLIITIPAGIQSFKLAGFALWPFGRAVVDIPGRSPTVSLLLNVIWIVTGGFWLAVAHVVAGLVLMVTIVGIPFGIASIKMAGLALAPFGKQVVDASRVRAEADAITIGR